MGQEYVSVNAQEVQRSFAAYTGTSDGVEQIPTSGYMVNWTREGGYTGNGWAPKGEFKQTIEDGGTVIYVLTGTEGPTVGVSETEILTTIDSEGSLTSYFRNWNDGSQKVTAFAMAMHAAGCATPV